MTQAQTRRARGDGTYRELGPERYEIRWRDRRGTQQSKVVRGTSEDALRELRARTAARDAGVVATGRDMRLDAWLGRVEPTPAGWLAMVTPGLRPRSATRYADIVRLYLVPALGRVRLGDLTPEHVTGAMDEWAMAGASASSIAYRVRILRMALGRALQARRVVYNAAALVDLPAWRPAEITPPDEHAIDAILARVAGTPLEVAYALAIGTGIRQGELLALRWRDVDLGTGLVTIRASRVYGSTLIGAPKTRAGRRVLPLPGWTHTILARHHGHPDSYLIATSSGRPLDARNLLRRHQRLCAELGLPPSRWHDLRHYAATRLLQRGVSVAMVGRYLGHADLSTTVDTYGHLVVDRDTAAAMDR